MLIERKSHEEGKKKEGKGCEENVIFVPRNGVCKSLEQHLHFRQLF
jgi:hypothetical protein